MSPDRHAAVVVAMLARLPQDGPPRPVTSSVVAASISYALRHHAELARFSDADLRRLADAIADRIPYRPG